VLLLLPFILLYNSGKWKLVFLYLACGEAEEMKHAFLSEICSYQRRPVGHMYAPRIESAVAPRHETIRISAMVRNHRRSWAGRVVRGRTEVRRRGRKASEKAKELQTNPGSAICSLVSDRLDARARARRRSFALGSLLLAP
jgi:hypothetical protein